VVVEGGSAGSAVTALEVERIAEAQRFSARLDAERDARRLPGSSTQTE
jgi:hypothetical protein